MIAIKNMRMPKHCLDCALHTAVDYGMPICPFFNRSRKRISIEPERPEWCPLVEIEPAKHAEWKEDGALYKCTNCGHTEGYYDMSYCPECGARMDE